MGDQPEVGRDRDEGRRRSVAVAHRIRGGVEPSLVDRRQFRERPLAPEQPLVGAPDPHPGPEGPDLRPHGNHLPGEIAAHDERHRERKRHAAGADVGVDRIDGTGPHSDERFARAGHRVGEAADLDHVGRSGPGDEGGPHRPLTFRFDRTPPTPTKASRAPTAAAVRRPFCKEW